MSGKAGSMNSTSVQDDRDALLNPTSTALRGSSDPDPQRAKGLSMVSTGFFILTGVLFTIPLPYALLQTGLISGVLLMTVLPLVMVYMGVLLGRCWVIMLDLWPERYSGQRVRRPFPAIGMAAGGRFWDVAVRVSVNLTNIGVTVVDLLVAVATIQILLPGHFSDRVWLLFCTAAMMPFVWLGSPMESWLVGWIGGIMGLAASLLLLVAVAVGGASPSLAAVATTAAAASSTFLPNVTTVVGATTPAVAPATLLPALGGAVTFSSFWIGASTLTFTYAGMSIFPTLQHDMREPRQWTRTLVVTYVFISTFALATAVIGLTLFGKLTNANVLLNIQCRQSAAGNLLATICSALYALVSLCNGVVTVLPVVQDAEDLVRLPPKANYKHILLRTVVMLACLGAAEGIPHFDKYIALIGATTISLNNFVFPPLFYYWLSLEKGKRLGLGQRTFFGEMIVFGVVCAVAGCYSSVQNIIGTSAPLPC